MSLTDALSAHPARDTFNMDELIRAIESCQQCMTACALCADSDLARDPAGMADCIRTCLDCATVAAATATILSRPNPSGDAWKAQVQACIAACRECVQECSDHDHACCQNCSTTCSECVDALEALLAVAS